MPNRREHELAGLWFGLLVNVIDQTLVRQEKEFSFLEAGAAGLGGLLGGRLPDQIEPAQLYGPNHRRGAHSVTTGVGMAMVSAKSRKLENRVMRGFVQGGTAGYLSHLALDSQTPKGLPWIK